MSDSPGTVRIDDLGDPRLPDPVVAFANPCERLWTRWFPARGIGGDRGEYCGPRDFGDESTASPTRVVATRSTRGGARPARRLLVVESGTAVRGSTTVVVDYLKQHPAAAE